MCSESWWWFERTQRSFPVMKAEWRAINQAMATFYCYIVMVYLFIISQRAVKNAPSVTWSHDSQLFVRLLYCSWGLLPPPHAVKCTMEMCLLATSVYPSFEFFSIFLLSMHTDCSSRLIKDGRKRRFKLFCPTAASLRVDRQWLVHHHPPDGASWTSK